MFDADTFYEALAMCLVVAADDATKQGHPRALVARFIDAAYVCERARQRSSSATTEVAS